jgi:phosphoribosyl-ATP pyrophosphohydrolase/phosphoribosyl-AMP cyclohydrolase
MEKLFEKITLIPCIVQSAVSQEVLMLAYMNAASFKQTLDTQILTFYSRSRAKLWIKGETSGNRLELISLTLDCDSDTLLAIVKPSGPVCHTGSATCFDREPLLALETLEPLNPSEHILNRLFNRISDRKKEPKKVSYTQYLFEQGIDKMLKKIGEEASEVIIAAKNPSNEAVLEESADLLYHLWVLLAERELKPEALYQVLEKRHQ